MNAVGAKMIDKLSAKDSYSKKLLKRWEVGHCLDRPSRFLRLTGSPVSPKMTS